MYFQSFLCNILRTLLFFKKALVMTENYFLNIDCKYGR